MWAVFTTAEKQHLCMLEWRNQGTYFKTGINFSPSMYSLHKVRPFYPLHLPYGLIVGRASVWTQNHISNPGIMPQSLKKNDVHMVNFFLLGNRKKALDAKFSEYGGWDMISYPHCWVKATEPCNPILSIATTSYPTEPVSKILCYTSAHTWHIHIVNVNQQYVFTVLYSTHTEVQN